jgi:hypothetical protein
MEPERHDSGAGVATSSTNKKEQASTDGVAIGGAGDASVTALDQGIEYTLTVPQAMERFALTQRKVPSHRSMERYCHEGLLSGRKIKTAAIGDDGRRVNRNEWLINEQSLDAYIHKQPIIVSGDAGDAMKSPAEELPRKTTVATNANGDAGGARVGELAAPLGETRSLATVLIENSKLLATLEGKEELLRERDRIIEEVKDDRAFLREEVRESRKQRDDIKTIAQKMLETLGAMSLASLGLKQATFEPQPTEIITPTGESRAA